MPSTTAVPYAVTLPSRSVAKSSKSSLTPRFKRRALGVFSLGDLPSLWAPSSLRTTLRGQKRTCAISLTALSRTRFGACATGQTSSTAPRRSSWFARRPKTHGPPKTAVSQRKTSCSPRSQLVWEAARLAWLGRGCRWPRLRVRSEYRKNGAQSSRSLWASPTTSPRTTVAARRKLSGRPNRLLSRTWLKRPLEKISFHRDRGREPIVSFSRNWTKAVVSTTRKGD